MRVARIRRRATGDQYLQNVSTKVRQTIVLLFMINAIRGRQVTGLINLYSFYIYALQFRLNCMKTALLITNTTFEAKSDRVNIEVISLYD